MQLCLLTVSCTWSVWLSPLVSLDLRELRVESRERRVSEGRERRVSECREPEPLDGLEQLYRALEQANVTAVGDPRPCSRQELRRCFIQRARDPLLNDRLHRVRALRSTLKVSLTTSVTNATKIWHVLKLSNTRKPITPLVTCPLSVSFHGNVAEKQTILPLLTS